MDKTEYTESKALKHSNLEKLEYIGKCLYLESMGKKLVAIGDLHLGYEEAMNEAGVLLTREMFGEMIEYLRRVFEKCGNVDKIILLGDIKHDFGNVLRQEREDFVRLISYLKEKMSGSGEIIIVKGNHDIIIEYVVKTDRVKTADYFTHGEYCFAHGDREFEEMNSEEIKFWVLGHGHPAIKISDDVKVEKYKCYLVGKYKGKNVIIVPSFLEYNEGSDARESNLGMAWNFDLDKFDVKIVDSDELKVLDFGKLGDIN